MMTHIPKAVPIQRSCKPPPPPNARPSNPKLLAVKPPTVVTKRPEQYHVYPIKVTLSTIFEIRKEELFKQHIANCGPADWATWYQSMKTYYAMREMTTSKEENEQIVWIHKLSFNPIVSVIKK